MESSQAREPSQWKACVLACAIKAAVLVAADELAVPGQLDKHLAALMSTTTILVLDHGTHYLLRLLGEVGWVEGELLGR